MSKKRFYNRLIAFIVAVAMIVAMMPLQVVSVFADDTPSGDGSVYYPYQIETAYDLYWFAKWVNDEGNTSANAILTTDIKVEDGENNQWTPIGTFNNEYTGTFNGNGKTISGLYYDCNVDGGEDHVGLFGYSKGTIENVGVTVFTFNGSANLGGICGYNDNGSIINCYSKGTVSGVQYVGGICGYNYNGSIINCYSAGYVKGDDVGGICGYNSGTVENVYVTGTVSGSVYVGGICAQNKSGTVENVYVTGTVSGIVDVGGICAKNDSGTVKNAYVAGTVSGSDIICAVNVNGQFSNIYFLSDGTSGGTSTAITSGVTAKSSEEFTSGEVCYLLNENDGNDKIVWYQNLSGGDISDENIDSYPVLNSEHGVVYSVGDSYTNKEPCKHTSYTNGICDDCGEYQAATTNTDGYYEIDNAGKLYWFAQLVNSGKTEINAILTANIKVNENVLNDNYGLNNGSFKAWTPIGNMDKPYNGTFDGKGHTISGLYYDGDASCASLFGFTGSDATIMNVGVEDFYLKGTTGNAADVGALVGAICGCNMGNIKNCYAIGYVAGDYYIGGICAYNVGTIENGYAVVSVSVIGDGVFGLITGKNYGTVKDVYCPTSATYNAVGENDENWGIDSSVSISSDAFASGEVCYLLNTNDGIDDIVWYQTIEGENKESYPVFDDTHGTVYASVSGDTTTYSNSDVCKHPEFDKNGICVNCGKGYQEPETTKVGSKTYYDIANAGNLYWFAEKVNSGSTSIYGRLTDDIVVNEKVLEADGSLVANASSTLRVWTPIGDYNTSKILYYGTFDGQGHTISGLYFDDSTKDYVGLFGWNYNGTITNVGVKDFYFNGQKFVGGISGSNSSGTISNCYAIGSLSSDSYAGGISGTNGRTLKDCYARVNVIGSFRVGGICGNSPSGTISNCYVTGSVSGTSNSSTIGAICGNVATNIVTNCYYLEGTASNGLGSGTGVTEGVSKEELVSGKVCYLLNNGVETSKAVWKQTIDTTSGTYPSFTGDIVNRYTATGGNLYGNNKVVKYVDSTVTAVDFTTLDVTGVESSVLKNDVVAYVAENNSLNLDDNVTKKYVVSDLDKGGVSLVISDDDDFKFKIVVNTLKFGGAVADGADFLEEVDVIANETKKNQITEYTEDGDNIEFKVNYDNPETDSTVRGQVQVKKWGSDDAEKPIDEIIYYVTKAFKVSSDGTISE